MPEKITLMLSSTIADMPADRDAVVKLFEKYPFVEVVGAKPIQKSYSANPYSNTLDMAESCDFYVLLLGARYGCEIRPGLSATEAEFDRAYRSNPTKILVFKNNSISPEEKQKIFIEKVGDYYKGYWISDYGYSHELQGILEESFLSLLKERASIGSRLSFVDHFLRLAVQRRPTQDALVFYSVNENIVELNYKWQSKSHILQFNRSRINSDFWGCISELEKQFSTWI
ncbi:DUF4062 domain-containing protein [Pseudomonas sp.]|uniref:DUF4062 domain-containing protein n=1 Tax=Pseudomonas sp. TaxID=306 RepID=UPI0032422359